MTLRQTVHALLDADPPSRPASLLRGLLAAMIVANVAAVVLETVPALQSYEAAFDLFEQLSVLVFGTEYLLRLWTAPELADYRGPWGRLRWSGSFAAVVDLVAVLPSVLAVSGVDLRVVRIARLLRILRLAKLERYSVALQTLHRVLAQKATDLLSLLFLLVVLLVVSSTLMFQLEHEAQPRGFSSIPATMWWGIVTLTTIGYGDLAPVTAAGRVLGGIIAVLGIGMFALPAGLLGAAFVDELGKARARAAGGDPTVPATSGHTHGPRCPHCGKPLDPTA